MRHDNCRPRWGYPDERDGRMYDDRPRSRSPGAHANACNLVWNIGQSHSSYARGRGSRYQDSRDDNGHGRQGYRDRDHEGYQSPQYSRSTEYSHDSRDYNRGSEYARSSRDRNRSPEYSRDSRDSRGHNRSSEYSRDSRDSRDHNRSQFYSRQNPGQESREVILERVPVDMTDIDIETELRSEYDVPGLEKVRLIRDRHTSELNTIIVELILPYLPGFIAGISRQIAFLKFECIQDSKRFMDQNFPAIYLYGPNGEQSTKVGIAYSRERDNGVPGQSADDWICRMCSVVNFAHHNICSSCKAPKPALQTVQMKGNGETDVSEKEVSHVLIFRGLEASVTEEVLATAAKKLLRPTPTPINTNVPRSKMTSSTSDAKLGAKSGSILRVFLVRDRDSNASWRFGFAEFANERDAQDAMAKLRTFEKFTVSSKPVTVNYIHSGVFVTVADPSTQDCKFSFAHLRKPKYFRYWDPQGYASEYVLEVTEEAVQPVAANIENSHGQQTSQPQGFISAEKGKKRKAEPAASINTNLAPPQLEFWRKQYAELHNVEESADDNVTATEKGPDENSVNDSYLDYELNCCWLCIQDFEDGEDLGFHSWHDEVHLNNLQDEEALARGKLDPGPTFIDPKPDSLVCLLCMKKLPDIIGLMWHVRIGDMHRNNLKDEEVVAFGLKKVAARHAELSRRAKEVQETQNGKDTSISEQDSALNTQPAPEAQKLTTDAQPDPEYRDRAKERRLAFGQVEVSGRQQKSATPEEDNAPVKPNSKGASLLKRMGWVEGTGLGVHGTGRVDPIAQQAYAEGVGLGAKGSKIGDATEEAGRKTRGLQHEFLDKTKESARHRYDEMAKEG
ncbi:hypothetical protein N7495_009609 [Penicillium taxi]|uniref:uncharacterized protein n=1 Tax=Penicillium taxi TaxID=168475 RepID=UPI0025455E76|nr:uncharacterized protein N7495_009609 [Penicillium taxi]KAJ5885099.1 hypothetical protein N7495_009609 [Penicillium taxi]